MSSCGGFEKKRGKARRDHRASWGMDFAASTHRARWIFDQDSLVGFSRQWAANPAWRGRAVAAAVRAVAPRSARRRAAHEAPRKPAVSVTPWAESPAPPPGGCRLVAARRQAAKREEAQRKAAESLKRSREPTPAASGGGSDDGAPQPDAKKPRGAPPARSKGRDWAHAFNRSCGRRHAQRPGPHAARARGSPPSSRAGLAAAPASRPLAHHPPNPAHGPEHTHTHPAPCRRPLAADAPVTAAEEAALRRYFELRIRAVCEAYPLPPKVAATAAAYFKRFYVRRSCLEHDPSRIMPTCIYLAAKVRGTARARAAPASYGAAPGRPRREAGRARPAQPHPAPAP